MISRCHYTLPKTTWVYLGILGVVVVGAIMREINLLIILAGLMAGPILMSWQLIRLTLNQIAVDRRMPHGVFSGQAFVVELEVRNRRKRLDGWGLVVEDRIRNVTRSDVVESKTARAFVPYVAAGERVQASYRARLTERGRYRFGPLRLSTKVPVGLLEGFVRIRETSDVLVYPRLGALATGWTELIRFDQVGQRSWRRHQGPVEGDFYGLRDWRAGDSRRWIHWRSSAKRQELLVRQFEQHRDQDFVVLLDLLQAPNELPPTQAAALVEKTISFVATIMAEQCRRGGGRLTMGLAGADPRILRGTASAALLQDGLEMLSEAMPTEQDELPGLLPDALAGTSPGDRLMIVSLAPIDLLDAQRFPELDSEGAVHASLRQAILIDIGNATLSDVFRLEDESLQNGASLSEVPQ